MKVKLLTTFPTIDCAKEENIKKLFFADIYNKYFAPHKEIVHSVFSNGLTYLIEDELSFEIHIIFSPDMSEIRNIWILKNSLFDYFFRDINFFTEKTKKEVKTFLNTIKGKKLILDSFSEAIKQYLEMKTLSNKNKEEEISKLEEDYKSIQSYLK